MSRPTVAVFRPDDGRAQRAREVLGELGAAPLVDPMLAVEPTGATPRTDADYTVLTSTTAAGLARGEWALSGTVCAIGEATASALREAGYAVDVVPGTYSSRGLVDRLADEVAGARVEVARSDHGSEVLLDGLESAGAYVHETVLYELVRPDGAGESAERVAAGEVDAALFTSTLTVEHFLAAAADRGVRDDAVDGLNRATVGAIGEPTREAARAAGVAVDVVPEAADFEALARETLASV